MSWRATDYGRRKLCRGSQHVIVYFKLLVSLPWIDSSFCLINWWSIWYSFVIYLLTILTDISIARCCLILIIAIRWPFFETVFKNAEEEGQFIQFNWLEEIKAQLRRRKQLKTYLSEMSATHYGRLQISYSDMANLDALILPDIGARASNYYLLGEELGMICNDEKWETFITQFWCEANYDTLFFNFFRYSLSVGYYAGKIATYISQTYVTKEWQKFLAVPKKKQTIEHAMLLVAQWMQPSKLIYANEISNSLDDIAQLTKNLIAKEHPHLSINGTPLPEEAEWKNEILDDNKWSAEDSMIIISALCKTMFTTLGFKSCASRQTLMINQVRLMQKQINDADWLMEVNSQIVFK